MVAEHGGAPRRGVLHGLLEVAGKAVAIEDVVAQHQGARLAGDELLADGEGLRQAVRAGLLGVGEVHAVARAVPEQALEVGQVGRRGDDQDVPDARQHEGGQRVVDHGLVVDRQQLLGGHERERVQARAGPAGEDDTFHKKHSSHQALYSASIFHKLDEGNIPVSTAHGAINYLDNDRTRVQNKIIICDPNKVHRVCKKKQKPTYNVPNTTTER